MVTENLEGQLSLDDWMNDQRKDLAADTSLGAMDDMVKMYVQLRDEYDEAKKASSEVYARLESMEGRLIQVLEAAKKKSYKVDGVGTFSMVIKQTVKVPADIGKKRELFTYIKKNYGDDALDSMTAIHHQTLNAFYNQEVEKHKDDPMFHLPGIEAPMARKEPRFTREKS